MRVYGWLSPLTMTCRSVVRACVSVGKVVDVWVDVGR